MSAIFTPNSGQSNYDILLQNYGNPDYFIKMLSDSGVVISSQAVGSYLIDQGLKNINSNFTGVNYSTLFNQILAEQQGLVLLESGGRILTEDGGLVLCQ